MSDVILIAGVSKNQGSQFSLKKSFVLSDRDEVLTVSNLRKKFDCHSDSPLFNYNTPYLAGIYLYNYLTRRGIHCDLITFLDLEIEKFKTLLHQNPKAVALSSSFLTNVRAVKEVTDTIRRYAPDIKIILGGPLIYNSYLLYQRRLGEYDTDSCKKDYFFLNDEKPSYEDIDLFIIEEQGAETLFGVISAIKHARSYENLPNIAYYRKGQPIFTRRQPEHFSFADDLIKWESVPQEYIYPIFPARGSIGCPYRCKFCNFAPGRSFHLKKTESLVQEIDALLKTDRVQMVRFTDDNLFLNKNYIDKFCRKIIALDKDLKWTSFIRANSVDKDNVHLLKESGLTLAQIGMESGDAAILNAMDKKDVPENYLRVVDLLNSHGISTQVYFIIGFPGETLKTLENTISLINQFSHHGPAINELMVFPFVFAPLSPVYNPKNRIKYGINGYMTEWTHRTMSSTEAFQYARDLFLQVDNIYPHYGIEEFLLLDMPRLKRISHLRTKIRKAQLNSKPATLLQRDWDDLKKEVCLVS